MMWLMEQSMHIITDFVLALITYTGECGGAL